MGTKPPRRGLLDARKFNASAWARLLTIVASALFVAAGVGMIASGYAYGWFFAGLFGLSLLLAVRDAWSRRRDTPRDHRLVMIGDGIACEHPARSRESIRWEDVDRIWRVTTADGPRRPEQWLVLEGETGSCSVPMEARGFEAVRDELKRRFAGFEDGPPIRGGAGKARHLCWERQRVS